MNKFKRLAQVVFLPLLLCCFDNKDMPRAAESTTIEPAMIISREDAKALTGVSFDECVVREQPAVGLKLCVYEKDDAFLQLGLTQPKKGEKNSPESIYNSIKGAFENAAKIDGVGDDNFIAPPGLHIMKDGYYITISLGLMTKDREKLKVAGMKAVQNLDRYTQKK